MNKGTYLLMFGTILYLGLYCMRHLEEQYISLGQAHWIAIGFDMITFSMRSYIKTPDIINPMNTRLGREQVLE